MARDPVGKLLWFASEFFLENASVPFVRCRNTIGHSYYLCKSWHPLFQNPRYHPKFQPSRHHQYLFVANILEEVFLSPNAIFCTDFYVLGHKMLIRPKKLLSASHLVSSLNTVYTRQYSVFDDGHLTIVFFTFTTYSKPSSSKYRRTVLVVTGFGKLVFKFDAILLPLMWKSPLTNPFK